MLVRRHQIAKTLVDTSLRALATTSIDPNHTYDVCIVGGGIIGCATAMQLRQKYPNKNIVLLEKEKRLAAHQSGHNSGVLHAGIYYTPGTLKAKLCVRGIDLAYDYCDKHNVPYKKCGKLIIATDDVEVQRLKALFERALENKCKNIELIDGKRIQEFEPNCVGKLAIWSPHTGIVDWGRVTKSYGETFENDGGHIQCNFQVDKFSATPRGGTPHITITGANGQVRQWPIHTKLVRARHVITCAGLYADKLSVLTGCSPIPKIVPFRGEYLVLRPEKRDLVKTNIYPVPDPRFPFLGFHFTPRMNGDVWLGPNAVLAFAREGYDWVSFNRKELWDAMTFRGMQRLMLKYAGFGMGEMYRSFSIPAQVKSLQKFVPSLRVRDVTRGKNTSGVRAQALDDKGNLVDDFIVDQPALNDDARSQYMHWNVLHVRNAPSPAATSSLAIAELILERAEERFGLGKSAN